MLLFPFSLIVLLMKSLLCAKSMFSIGKTVMLLLSPHHQGAHRPVRKNRMGAGEMALWIKCLPSKSEALSLDPWNLCKKLGMMA